MCALASAGVITDSAERAVALTTHETIFGVTAGRGRAFAVGVDGDGDIAGFES